MNIAITGVSGYIGTKLLRYLDGVDDVTRIIGIDIREPSFRSSKLEFHYHDVCQPLGDLLAESKVETAVHLAFILRPTRQTVQARQIDIGGTTNLLEACRQADVKHILYLSSHTVYGAHKDNPMPLTEDSPLRPVPGFQYSKDKIEIEGMLRDFSASSHDITLTVLRCCPVIGPNAGGTATTIMFQPLVMVGVTGCDPLMQFVHEDDLVSIMGEFITRKKAGIYNVAGDGTIKYSKVARLLGKKLMKLPEQLLKPVISLSWATHLQSASPSSGVEFIKYPPVVSTDKLKEALGYRFKYSSKEALTDFTHYVTGKQGL